MDFIKRHYEKVILMGLFAVFIGLMVLVQSVISSTREVNENDLHLPQRMPDYENIDPASQEFDTDARWENSRFQWNAAETSKSGLPTVDFVSMFELADCPFCHKDNIRQRTLIPKFYFDQAGGKCPECNSELIASLNIDVQAVEDRLASAEERERARKEREENERRIVEEEDRNLRELADNIRKEEEEFAKGLEDIAESLRKADENELNIMMEIADVLYQREEERRKQEEEARRIEEEKDKDDDGLLDEIESVYGMDSNDKYDVAYDNDGDGFSNLFELQTNTGREENEIYRPNDPAHHPPLWWRLRVKDVRQIELSVRFMALIHNDSKDKSSWMMQFNLPDPRRPGRTMSRYLSIGGTLDVDGRPYKVEDAELIVTDRKRAAGNLDAGDVTEKIDESKVVLVEVVPEGETREADRLTLIINQVAHSNDRRPVLMDTGHLNRREYILRVGDTVTLGVFAPREGSNVTALSRTQRRAQTRTYRLKSVDAQSGKAQFEEVVTGDRQPDTPGVFTIDRQGKVPEKLWPIRKVERRSEDEDDEIPGSVPGMPSRGSRNRPGRK
ncbi:MAG: hypothetical protein IKC94_00745 [Lentisphaeria bacterium]|nr:hypothetical protein [Lentisphaeria bacterium]